MCGMHDAPVISPDKKDSSDDDFRNLPKVLLRAEVDGTAGGDAHELETAVQRRVQALADDNVIYLELHVLPTAQGFSDPAVAADALVRGLRAVEGIDARGILIIDKDDAADTAQDIARVAKETDGIVGLGVAERDLGEVTAAIETARHAFLPVTVDVGIDKSTPHIAEAVRSGADRLGWGTNLIDDFTADIEGIQPGKVSRWVRDRHIPVETVPLGTEDLADHPLPLLQQLGFTCNVGVGSKGELTEVFSALHETLGYGLEEFFDLTVKAIENSFLTEPERQHLIETAVLPAYEELSDVEFAEDAADDAEKGD